MTERKLPVVALVDDDRVYQFTASKTLQLTRSVETVLTFLMADEALAFLRTHAADKNALPDYIFLDINMPLMDGWMFLDDFKELQPQLIKPVTVYMVSSSIDPKDINRAESNPLVKEYLTKPVSLEKFSQLVN